MLAVQARMPMGAENTLLDKAIGMRKTERITTITQIAERAEVSVATVSLVLNKGYVGPRISQATANKIRRIASQMSYAKNYHATSIRRGRAETIAVALDFGFRDNPALQDGLSLPYFATIIGGIDVTLRSHGLLTTIVGPDAGHSAPERGYQGILERRFDGLIVLGVVVTEEHASFLKQAHERPVVILDAVHPCADPAVYTDQPQAMAMILAHLQNLGHRHLLRVVRQGMGSRDQRTDAFCIQAKQLQMEVEILNYELISRDSSIPLAPGQHNQQSAAAAMRRRLTDKPIDFTAIVCFNDNTAVGVMDAIRESGFRVPEDFSVVGYDNHEARLMRPMLTSIDPHFHQLGRRGAEVLLSMLDSPAAPTLRQATSEYVTPSLQIRDSTGPAGNPG